jgi:hypothetical protein
MGSDPSRETGVIFESALTLREKGLTPLSQDSSNFKFFTSSVFLLHQAFPVSVLNTSDCIAIVWPLFSRFRQAPTWLEK